LLAQGTGSTGMTRGRHGPEWIALPGKCHNERYSGYPAFLA
jgi:hypothetical protein